MNCFRTSADTMAALARYDDLPVDGLPLEFLQNKEPKLLRRRPARRSTWPQDPDLEWCPPGHGDIYTALRGTGLLDRLIEAGYRHVFVSNSDNLGAVPDARVAGWFAASRRAVRDRGGAAHAVGPQGRPLRPPQDRRPDRAARDRADARPEDQEALADLSRHRFCSTNNLWFDLAAMKRRRSTPARASSGLPLIRNVKTRRPRRPVEPRR